MAHVVIRLLFLLVSIVMDGCELPDGEEWNSVVNEEWRDEDEEQDGEMRPPGDAGAVSGSETSGKNGINN